MSTFPSAARLKDTNSLPLQVERNAVGANPKNPPKVGNLEILHRRNFFKVVIGGATALAVGVIGAAGARRLHPDALKETSKLYSQAFEELPPPMQHLLNVAGMSHALGENAALIRPANIHWQVRLLLPRNNAV